MGREMKQSVLIKNSKFPRKFHLVTSDFTSKSPDPQEGMEFCFVSFVLPSPRPV